MTTVGILITHITSNSRPYPVRSEGLKSVLSLNSLTLKIDLRKSWCNEGNRLKNSSAAESSYLSVVLLQFRGHIIFFLKNWITCLLYKFCITAKMILERLEIQTSSLFVCSCISKIKSISYFFGAYMAWFFIYKLL